MQCRVKQAGSALLFLWLFFPLTANAAALPEAFVVRQVTLHGVASVPAAEIRKALAARPRPFWRPWEPEETLNAQDLKDDQERIRQFYRARGFYHTRIDAEAEPTGDEAKKTTGESGGPLPVVRVVFSVKEGPPVTISEVRVDTFSAEPSEEELLHQVPLKKGQIFTESDYRAAKKSLERSFQNRGFPFPKIEGRVRVDVRENLARVVFTVDPGRALCFGAVKIVQEGATVSETVVLRALRFKTGEPYSASAVEQSRRNLINLDVFRSALILPGQPEADNDSLPMEVRLRSKEPRQVGFGIGYGSEDGLRLRASWTYRNAFSRAGRFTFSASRTDLIQNVQAEYGQPYWIDAKTDLRSRAGWERELFDSYTNRKQFLNAALDRRLPKNWTGTLGYGLEDNKLEEVDIADPIERLEFIRNNEYLISSVNIGIGRKRVDSELYPTAGEVFTLASEQAFAAIGSELSFVNPSVELRAYRTPWGRVTFGGRLKLESIAGIGDTEFIPIFKRLFLGGSNTVRGYGYRMLGPLDANGVPVGGKSAANANIEARFPIYGSFSGVVFFDAGMVDPESFHFDTAAIRTACGAGFRYDSVIGPLRVEFGYKLNPEEESALPPGVEPESRWRIHFNVGQTF
ncbi:MAG: BamA/TamA family outer membrane protein [Desulfobacterales bacterium]|jgi:outer membrane protein insertion porin family/translocation and assembly module TamA